MKWRAAVAAAGGVVTLRNGSAVVTYAIPNIESVSVAGDRLTFERNAYTSIYEMSDAGEATRARYSIAAAMNTYWSTKS